MRARGANATASGAHMLTTDNLSALLLSAKSGSQCYTMFRWHSLRLDHTKLHLLAAPDNQIGRDRMGSHQTLDTPL